MDVKEDPLLKLSNSQLKKECQPLVPTNMLEKFKNVKIKKLFIILKLLLTFNLKYKANSMPQLLKILLLLALMLALKDSNFTKLELLEIKIAHKI